jgi:hypothetical protein
MADRPLLQQRTTVTINTCVWRSSLVRLLQRGLLAGSHWSQGWFRQLVRITVGVRLRVKLGLRSARSVKNKWREPWGVTTIYKHSVEQDKAALVQVKFAVMYPNFSLLVHPLAWLGVIVTLLKFTVSYS